MLNEIQNGDGLVSDACEGAAIVFLPPSPQAPSLTPIPSSGSVPDGDGQQKCDAHHVVAVSTPSPAPKRGRSRKAIVKATPIEATPSSTPHTETAGNGGGENRAIGSATPRPASPDLSHTIALIGELQVRRTFCIKQRNRMNNATAALIRRFLGWQFDMPEKERKALNSRAAAVMALIESGKELTGEFASVGAVVAPLVLAAAKSREPLDNMLAETEREMRKLSKALPVWKDWALGVRGLGDLGLAVIVAEAGDIGSYATVSRLWKRLGLAVINGERQQRKSDADLAAEHGYNPRRRAEMFAVIGDPLFRGQWRGAKTEGDVVIAPAGPIGPYGEVYGREKAKAAPRIEATKELTAAQRWTPARVDKHARRLMTKALLRDLWRVWRGHPPRGSHEVVPEDMPNAPATDHTVET
ncbi:hypothetical protein [Azospirillum himalayense]|uniref:IS110 family transposase n=1 Tax=Azospirillum himalayense TaxID=654847 RepID=A0ABW0GBG2_9PROT